MSFDIYGNDLARGHCEVHPDVPEPFPCSTCVYYADEQPEQPGPCEWCSRTLGGMTACATEHTPEGIAAWVRANTTPHPTNPHCPDCGHTTHPGQPTCPQPAVWTQPDPDSIGAHINAHYVPLPPF